MRLAAELDVASNVLLRFVYANRSNIPDFMVKYTNSTTSGIYRILSDHLGSLRMVVNATNASDRPLEARYSAFGIPTAISGSLAAIPFGFAGGLYDADTGLVRFGARDYDARFGRWTHKDPILFDGGQTNLYVYVGNDPVNRVDPSGESFGDVDTEMIAGSAVGLGLGMLGFSGTSVAGSILTLGGLNFWNPVGFGLVAVGTGYLLYDAFTDDNNCGALDRAKDKLQPIRDRRASDKATLDDLFGK